MFYVDTSAFLKLIRSETHTTAFRRWAERHDDALASCDLLRTEALRAARRDSPEALRATRHALDAVLLLHLTSDVFERAAELDPAILRSLDALHIAAALTLGDELEAVVTYDERMTEACESCGLDVLNP